MTQITINTSGPIYFEDNSKKYKQALHKIECIVDKIRNCSNSKSEIHHVLDLLDLFDPESGNFKWKH